MNPLAIAPPTPPPPKEKPAEMQASDVQGTPAELLARKQILQDLKQRMQERSASRASSHSRPPEEPRPPEEETYYDTDLELNVDQRIDLLDAAHDKHFKWNYEIHVQLDTLANKVALLPGAGAVPHQNLLRKHRYDMSKYYSSAYSPTNTSREAAVFDIASPLQPKAPEAQALNGLQDSVVALGRARSRWGCGRFLRCARRAISPYTSRSSTAVWK